MDLNHRGGVTSSGLQPDAFSLSATCPKLALGVGIGPTSPRLTAGSFAVKLSQKIGGETRDRTWAPVKVYDLANRYIAALSPLRI